MTGVGSAHRVVFVTRRRPFRKQSDFSFSCCSLHCPTALELVGNRHFFGHSESHRLLVTETSDCVRVVILARVFGHSES
eukprot:TRINITY_DN4769_c0_g1_i1.p1 TRINITY_DN4769_c0_g1~~TRINITY_DN4769_c0_g1_i1.p1  ORF type:complete len:79 (-),score=11.33 TRINITY_DN4769_c0_g1_i1:78-314(-)